MTASRPMPTDAQLLSRFINDRDDRTFAAIVRKHGPMVFATCRRIAGHHHDAEDAFQACFLVLAAKAETVRPQSRLGAWLHGVAVRCALKARRLSRFTEVPLLESPAPERPAIEPDLVSHLDEALAAIPENYRAAVVLCHLQGRTRTEAARELGWSEGTLSGRLHRAMELLAKRLTARGVTAGVSLMLASAIVPAKLFASTNSAAALMIVGCSDASGSAANILAHGVLRTMTLRKLKLAACLLFLGTGFGAVALGTLTEAEAKPAPRRIHVKAPAPREVKKETLSGIWEQVTVENPLGKVPDDLVWTFEKETVTACRKAESEKVFLKYVLAADSGKDPKEISLTVEHGERKWVQHGIYKFDGNRLTICLGVAMGDEPVNESERPTEYKAGPDTCLVVLKRRKK